MALVKGQFRLGAIRKSQAWIRSRSNSTMRPRTVSISRPCGVVASAPLSPEGPVPGAFLGDGREDIHLGETNQRRSRSNEAYQFWMMLIKFSVRRFYIPPV